MSSYNVERDLGYREGYDAGIETAREISQAMYQDGLNQNPITKIVHWNTERNMQSNPVDDCAVVYCKLEELFEYLGIHKCFEDERQFKKLVNTYKTYIIDEAKSIGATATIEEKIDALCDDTVFNTGFVLRHGYNPVMALNETVKEIDSRTGSFNEETGKWTKDKSPEAMSKWVQADYSKCLI